MTDVSDGAPVLVEFQRGGADCIETRHRGSIAVVDPSGRLLRQVGDAGRAYALRSTAKPFQLLPPAAGRVASRRGRPNSF